jgi:hypothetical protein
LAELFTQPVFLSLEQLAQIFLMYGINLEEITYTVNVGYFLNGGINIFELTWFVILLLEKHGIMLTVEDVCELSTSLCTLCFPLSTIFFPQ